MHEHEASRYIDRHSSKLADAVVRRHYEHHEARWKSYGTSGWEKSIRDVKYHLSYLVEALDAEDPALFGDYVGWAKVLFAQLGFDDAVLSRSLTYLEEALAASLPEHLQSAALHYVSVALQHARSAPSEPASALDESGPMAELSRRYLTLLLDGERRKASQLIMDAVEEGMRIRSIYTHVFQPVQREIGRLWQINQISVAQEHYCTAATQLIMSQSYPHIFATERRDRRFLGTCVGGELHEVGVRMVTDFFEMDGWDTYYLGANTPETSILETIKSEKVDVIGISATMTFHVRQVASLIASIREADESSPQILVGGYPFNVSSGLWARIGADGYAPDADSAVALANNLVG